MSRRVPRPRPDEDSQEPAVLQGYGGLLRGAPWWDTFTLPDLTSSPEMIEDLLHSLATAFGVAGSAPESQRTSSVTRCALAAAVLERCNVEARGWWCEHALLDTTSSQTQLEGGGMMLDDAWEREGCVLWLPLGYCFDPLAPGDLQPPKVGGALAERRIQIGPLWVSGEPSPTPPALLGGLLAGQLVCYSPARSERSRRPEQEREWRRAQEDRAGVRMMCWLTARELGLATGTTAEDAFPE